MAASGTTRYGNGTGWGGAAKGASSAQSHDFEGRPGAGRRNFSQEGEARAERRARHVEEMCEILYGIAHNAYEPGLRIQAADKLLNRIEGLPVAKTEQGGTTTIIIEGGLPQRPR